VVDQLTLGWRTELIFARFDAQIDARRDYLVVRTPHNPSFWWGNFLLFDRLPREGDAAAWLAAFDTEIAQPQSESRHVAFGIDASQDFELPADFAAAGLARHASNVLTLRREQLRDMRKQLDANWAVRPLLLRDETAAAVDHQVASDAGDHEPEGYRIFRLRQMQRYAAMEQAGLGHWFGVFTRSNDGARLVADCGLFRDGFGAAALGRFQHVSTHPQWRRLGLCRALMQAVCRYGFDVMRLHTLVIVADPHDVAIGLYESLGFERCTNHWQLERRPPEDQR
jgi:RimJ/RimL family protein N-acetyltransferase